jgi:hypothetical protein
LWDMMTHEPPHSSCGWTGDGMAFCLSDPAKFAAEVLPQYFRHQKLSSFVRQLHYYGFEAMEKGMLADEGGGAGGGGAGTNAPRTYVHIGGIFHRDQDVAVATKIARIESTSALGGGVGSGMAAAARRGRRIDGGGGGGGRSKKQLRHGGGGEPHARGGGRQHRARLRQPHGERAEPHRGTAARRRRSAGPADAGAGAAGAAGATGAAGAARVWVQLCAQWGMWCVCSCHWIHRCGGAGNRRIKHDRGFCRVHELFALPRLGFVGPCGVCSR